MPIPSQSHLLPYQQRWLADTSQLKIMEKARQVGMSWITAYRAVRTHATCDVHYDAWVSSRDEAQARLFIDDCRSFAKALHIASTYKGFSVFPHQGRQSSYVLKFANGKSIHSLSSNPDAQAGKRGTRILDEFALHPDPKLLFAITYPGITWGGQLEIISTHRGSDNYFNDLIKEIREGGNPKNFSHHRVTLQDALEAGFLNRLKAKLPKEDQRQSMDDATYFDFIRKSCPDEQTFKQEYMCEPSDDTTAFIGYDLIEKNLYPDNEDWEISLPLPKRGQRSFYIGVDIGRVHDFTVFWLVEKVNDMFFTRKVITLKDTPFASQMNILKQLADSPLVHRICIDETGIGRQFVEEAKAAFGQGRVEGVTFTSNTKEQLAYPLRSLMEGSKLRIPNCPYIIADIRAIKKEVTFAGNIRFSADRGANGHSDRFWALALAVHGAGTGDVGQVEMFKVDRVNR